MLTLVDTHYLPFVSASRGRICEQSEALVEELATPRDALGFMLTFLALRIGPLGPIPHWLRTSAEKLEATHPEIAEALVATAEFEQRHRRETLLEDLIGVRRRWGAIDLCALIRQPFDARIERHARLRELVPTTSEPLVVLAVDLELAEFGRVFGPALIDASRRVLGPGGDDCLRFVCARSSTAEARVHARLAQLDGVLAQYPTRGRAWAKVASDVTESYIDALVAGLEHARTLGSQPRRSALALACAT